MEHVLNIQSVERLVEQIPPVFRVGHVSRVVGLVVEAFLPHVPVGAICRMRTQEGHKISAEVIGLKNDTCILMPFGSMNGIKSGDPIEIVRLSATVSLSDALLGRVINGEGEVLDGLGSIEFIDEKPLYAPPVAAVSRRLIDSPLSLGIRAIDGFLTCAKGQRLSIMAGSGVGKSTLLGMMARNTKADINVIALIGERGREVKEFLTHDLGEAGLARSVVVVATSDTPALVRMRAAFLATTVAEYFRDKGLNVLLMMDSLTRFAMASREVGLSVGEPPTMKGYTPSLFATLPRLLERAGRCEGEGSITGLYTILTEGDDIQDPIADAVRAIVDGHIVLSRKLASMGHYPPIDVLGSISRVMSMVVGKEHKKYSLILRRLLALYIEMEDYIKIGVYVPGKNPELDVAVAKYEELKRFLIQPIEEKTSYEETIARMGKMIADIQL
ncbi:FliI/YscN family ATPase [bacterium]|nr:FliI/YscN family ATPase [bacterium]